MIRIYPPMPEYPSPDFYEMEEPLEVWEEDEWVQTLECECKPDSLMVCKVCKLKLQSDEIPF